MAKVKAAKREMMLGSAEMTEETAALFSPRQWNGLLGLIARYTAQWWTVHLMPKRWTRTYAQAFLGKRSLGNDGVPYFQYDVKNRNRRWVAMAKRSVVKGGARGAVGNRVIRAAVKHPVPNVVRRSSLKSFSTIPNYEATTLGETVQAGIAEAMAARKLSTWRNRIKRKTIALRNRMVVVLGTTARKAEAEGMAFRMRASLLYQQRLQRSREKQFRGK